MMNGKIIIGGVVILICLIGSILLWQKISEPTQLPAQPTQELKLSDFPEKFKEKTVIVLGDNASEIERQVAEEIKNFLLEHGSSYIKVIDLQEIESFKRGYNLVIIGTPKTNPLLEEVYALTNATGVTEEFPGEGKGILEILPNPWDESKAMLLVEGSDEWGVKAGSEMLKGDFKLKVNLLEINWQQIIEIKNNITRYLAKNGERLYRIIHFTKIEGGWYLELYTTKDIDIYPYPREPVFYGHIVEISDKGEILMDKVVYTGHEILIPIPNGGEQP